MRPQAHPLIAILRGIEAGEVIAHADVLLGLGFGMIEIPLNSPQWEESLATLVAHAGDRAAIGGGTVLSIGQVDRIAELGGRLVVTPNTRGAVIRRAREHGLTVIAGVATPSEAFDALDAGAQALKLFPAASLGSGLATALHTVLPPVPLYAVGGITPQNLGEFIAAGCAGAGLGGALYRAGQSAEQTRKAASGFIAALEGAGR